MFYYQGKTALITGASSGIGEIFAQELAKRGMNLILIARSEDKLQKLARELHQKYEVSTNVIVADLSREHIADEIFQKVQAMEISVDMLINNAGFLNYAPFEKIDPKEDHAQVMVNVMALVDLTHAFVPTMIAKGEGAIINLSSSGAFQPMPFMAVYGACKAFVLSFSEALWSEYGNRGLRVLALCPGPTSTKALVKVFDHGHATTPEQVVKAALKALEAGRCYVIPGLKNYLLANIVPRLMPRSITVKILDRITRPK
jgi:short-subunit dehydrogenase